MDNIRVCVFCRLPIFIGTSHRNLQECVEALRTKISMIEQDIERTKALLIPAGNDEIEAGIVF